MRNRKGLSPQQLHETFKTAFDTYKKYRDGENFIGAYVVAFSILEDRITASYVLLHQVRGLECPKGHKHFAEKCCALRLGNFIDTDFLKSLQEFAKKRNEKIHQAIFILNEFSAEDCEKVIKLAREADKLSRKLKKLTTKNEPKP
jgi:hypothetical protein